MFFLLIILSTSFVPQTLYGLHSMHKGMKYNFQSIIMIKMCFVKITWQPRNRNWGDVRLLLDALDATISLEPSVLNVYLCVEGALFIGIFSVGFGLKFLAFFPTHGENTKKIVFFSKQHAQGIWQLTKSKSSLPMRGGRGLSFRCRNFIFHVLWIASLYLFMGFVIEFPQLVISSKPYRTLITFISYLPKLSWGVLVVIWFFNKRTQNTYEKLHDWIKNITKCPLNHDKFL